MREEGFSWSRLETGSQGWHEPQVPVRSVRAGPGLPERFAGHLLITGGGGEAGGQGPRAGMQG